MLWICERDEIEYCGSVNEIQLTTLDLWTSWNEMLCSCERHATEYCGAVNGMQLNTADL